jgi:hypothetical protein
MEEKICIFVRYIFKKQRGCPFVLPDVLELIRVRRENEARAVEAVRA